MKVALLSLSMASVACLAGCAHDLQRSAYQDASSINKYSRRNIMAHAPRQVEIAAASPRYPNPYGSASRAALSGGYAYAPSPMYESYYDAAPYVPASYVSGSTVVSGGSGLGGFGGRSYRYRSSYPYLYDGYYGAGYYGGYAGGFGGVCATPPSRCR